MYLLTPWLGRGQVTSLDNGMRTKVSLKVWNVLHDYTLHACASTFTWEEHVLANLLVQYFLSDNRKYIYTWVLENLELSFQQQMPDS